jgi:hypothetical protein
LNYTTGPVKIDMPLLSDFSQKIRQSIPKRDELIRRARSGVKYLILFAGLYVLGMFMPKGFDWVTFFSKGRFPAFWMPWTKPLVAWLNYPTLIALTLLGMGVRAYRYRPSPLALALGLLSLPTLWMFHLGNVDGLAIFGLLILPWGAPLVLLKPQVAGFALLAKRSSLIATVVWLLISFAIWGLWPLTWRELVVAGGKADWPNDISLFPWGLLVALPLMWFSWGDEDLLMAAGSFATPHLFPYHFIALMPALARMRIPWMLLTWLISFTPFLSNWLGPWAWHFGNLMSVLFWLGIYLNLSPEQRRKRNLSLSWKEWLRA